MIGDFMGRIPEETIEKIIQNSDIIDVISEFVPLKKSGRNYMGVCPFHSDKGPSLSVSFEKQLYHCFGCGASGNVISFMMRIRNLEYINAIRFLADRANITIEEKEEDPKKAAQKLLKEVMFQINIEAARYFYSNLIRNEVPLDYFKRRNLDEKTLKKFGLGFSPNSWDSLFSYLLKKGFEKDLIYKTGLIIKDNNNSRYYDRFRNRIMFPVFDVKGKVIGFGGRVLDDSKPKYLNSPETPIFVKGTNLYGLNYIIKSGLPENIIIVEGYMDCIMLQQYGFNNVCASLGTALTSEQAKLLRRYSKDIYICYDADSAGRAATLRGLEVLTNVNCNVKIIVIPKGKDPDEFIKSYGKEAFSKLIENAIPIINYRIQRAKDGKNLRDPKQKGQFIDEVSFILSSVSNEVEAQAYASIVFDETGVDVQTILNQISKFKNGKNDSTNTTIENNVIPNNVINIEQAYKKAELLLLRFSIINDEYFNYIKGKIDASEFMSNTYKFAAEYILDAKVREEVINPNDLILKFENQSDINDISKIFLEEKTEIDNELIDDLIKTIKKANLESKIVEITVEIKKCEESKDIELSRRLMKNLLTLQRQLSQL
jgi:DNA primase